MDLIRELEHNDKNVINVVSRLHKKAFPKFFLSQLGIPFLYTLYNGYMEDNNSGIIVAEKNGKIVGFLAYSNDYSRFYKGLIKRHIIKFAFCSLGAAIRHPSFIKRLLGAFNKSDSVRKKEKYVELSSICVDPDYEGHGVGSRMIEFLKQKVNFGEYAYINLETDAENNDGANAFYKKNGFKLARMFVTSEGRKMNEYRYKEEM